jgi:hypothetical protein
MHKTLNLYFIAALMLLFSCSKSTVTQPVYEDKPFLQDYSIKYYNDQTGRTLGAIAADRNNVIKILSSNGLYQPYNGHFLYHGVLQFDNTYRPLKDRKVSGLITYEDQFVFLDDKAVFSDAWAGKLYLPHTLPGAKLIRGGADFTFLISDGTTLQLLKDKKVAWSGNLSGDEVIGLRYQKSANSFWILGKKSLSIFNANDQQLAQVFTGADFTAFDLATDGQKVVIGTTDGYLELDGTGKKQLGEINRKLPWTEITAVEAIGTKTWFGSTKGAFALNSDGKFDYYYGERWIPGPAVNQIVAGPENSVLILTNEGLGKICFKEMTLHDKAVYFDEQVRTRHIRNGFNASFDGMIKGNIASGYLSDSDNDGLWTSMYLGGEVFRYAVTKDSAALQNCRESLEAMERLYSVNPVKGFPSRSFERAGYINQLHDSDRWQHAPDPNWDWKSTTSSDEAIGHIFVFGTIAELMTDQPDLQQRAVALIDSLMSHIVDNDLYLIDYDGKPTTWGRWNPSYVNALPTNVGDRKINSSNIIAMLQTAYHFTKKEVFKEKAFELMDKHGYFTNLMRPMKEIGVAPDDADDHAKMLAESWNHSDDEMYFVGYWGLYRYALNDTLKTHFKEAILDHWEAERPEKEGAWNIFTALTGTPEFDLEEAAWYLREHPLDLIDWNVSNSHRKDIELLAPNFRKQTTKELLPPDEKPVQRHNGNTFTLDGGYNGTSEHSAGDIWLLPYWMGRYLGVISAPTK